jgi:dipeptidyl aminopeptidase/acylaminoacyl peptidase
VFSYQLKANKLTRWTNGNSPEVNTSAFAEPRLIRWKSFDGLEITGFHYHPSARFTGKRPVIINVHGGPASQARADFIGRYNYLVSELGVAIIYPNVRGSSGFGPRRRPRPRERRQLRRIHGACQRRAFFRAHRGRRHVRRNLELRDVPREDRDLPP